MSFGLYSIGFAIVIGGLIYAAYLLHMPAHWIAVGATVLLGVGILCKGDASEGSCGVTVLQNVTRWTELSLSFTTDAIVCAGKDASEVCLPSGRR